MRDRASVNVALKRKSVSSALIAGNCEDGNEPSGYIKGREFLNRLKDDQGHGFMDVFHIRAVNLG
jgi:hypothetical protein